MIVQMHDGLQFTLWYGSCHPLVTGAGVLHLEDQNLSAFVKAKLVTVLIHFKAWFTTLV